jgi:uncharacterized membrane-anchored protein YjiN (DUF445 family)
MIEFEYDESNITMIDMIAYALREYFDDESIIEMINDDMLDIHINAFKSEICDESYQTIDAYIDELRESKMHDFYDDDDDLNDELIDSLTIDIEMILRDDIFYDAMNAIIDHRIARIKKSLEMI